MTDDRPKTLAQMASDAESAANGVRQWSCQRCGGRLWWVTDSRFVAKDGSRRRTRECRQCHQVIRTVETIKSSTGRQLDTNDIDESD